MAPGTYKRERPQAFILVMSLFIIAALFLFGLSIVNLCTADTQLARRQEYMIVAEGAARAGLEDAIYQLKRDHSWSAGFNDVALPTSRATYTVTFNSSQNLVPWSTNNRSGATAVTGWGGASVPSRGIHLVSAGSFGNVTSVRQYMAMEVDALFEDTFDAGSVQWKQVTGSSYTVRSGSYIIGSLTPSSSSSSGYITFAGDPAWTDVVIETRAALIKGDGYGIFFRTYSIPISCAYPTSAYYTNNSINSYSFQFELNRNGGSFTFRTWVNGIEQATPLAEVQRSAIAGLPGDSTWWYTTQRTVRIEVTGSHFVAYVDLEPFTDKLPSRVPVEAHLLRLKTHAKKNSALPDYSLLILVQHTTCNDKNFLLLYTGYTLPTPRPGRNHFEEGLSHV